MSQTLNASTLLAVPLAPLVASCVAVGLLTVPQEQWAEKKKTLAVFGGGVVAAKNVTTSLPDGHTLALLSNATAVSAALFKALPYDPLGDFAPVGGVSEFSYVFLTNAKSGLSSLQDVIGAARARPGAINFGTAAAGTSPYLTALLFKKLAGIDFTIVPFRGATDLTVALLRNDVDVVINAYGAVKSNLLDGSLRAIVTTARTRSATLPARSSAEGTSTRPVFWPVITRVPS